MGDPSTHAVYRHGYWHLCFQEDGEWINTQGDQLQPVCAIGEEEAVVELKR